MPAQNPTARKSRRRRGGHGGSDARAKRGGSGPALAKAAGTRASRNAGPAEDTPGEGGLLIELSRSQVAQVVRAASGGRTISTVLSGMIESPERLAQALAEFDDTRLSRSLLSGLLVFAAFPADGESVGNVEVARMLGMNPSTAHRYISTFLEVGLLERDPGTRRYRLAR